MKLTKKNIRNIEIVSAVLAVAFMLIFLVLYIKSPVIDYLVVVAFTIGVTPPAIASIIHTQWKNKIEKALPEFLRDLATSTKTGMPLQTALENCAKRNYGPLTIELKTLVSNMSWGMNFNQALMEFSKRIDLATIKRASVLIMEAQRHGGDLSDIFEDTANYVDNVNQWNGKRKTQTMPYVAIFYFSVAIFLFIIIIISSMIFLPVSKEASVAGAIIKPVLTQTEAKRLFLDTALFESLFGGLVSGKINEDSFSAGLKHAAILAVVSGIGFYVFFH